MSKLLDKARGIVFDDDDDEEPSGTTAPVELAGDGRTDKAADGSGGGALPSRAVPAQVSVSRAPLREASSLSASLSAPVPERPRTAIGAITASIAIGRGVEAENRALKERVRELEDATVVEFLDPRTIRASRFANRHETAFSGAEFAALKAEIASAGRNVQPIKVRRIAPSSSPAGDEDVVVQRYELAFGHRRHRACLELGIPVAAIVESMTDPQLFAEMERENRERQNLSAWEQGTMYRRALDAGLFPSLRRLATAIGAQPGNVSAALQLAALPEEVVEAFGTPLALQYRWASPLKAALDADVEGVRERAKAIALLHPRPAPREILQRLTAPDSAQEPVVTVRQSLVLAHRGRVVGSWERDDRGDITCRIRAAGLNPARERRLLDAIARLFETSEAEPAASLKR